MNNEYVTGLHKYLQGQYGSEFKLNEQQFQEKLNNDPKYVNGLYTYLQGQYGSQFTLTPEEFSGKVKKKDQSSSGYNQTQPGSGSKPSQGPGFKNFNQFQEQQGFSLDRPAEPKIEKIPLKVKEKWEDKSLGATKRLQEWYKANPTPRFPTEKDLAPKELRDEAELEQSGSRLYDTSQLSPVEKKKYDVVQQAKEDIDLRVSASRIVPKGEVQSFIDYYNENKDKLSSYDYDEALKTLSDFKKELITKYGENFQVTDLTPEDADLYDQLSNSIISIEDQITQDYINSLKKSGINKEEVEKYEEIMNRRASDPDLQYEVFSDGNGVLRRRPKGTDESIGYNGRVAIKKDFDFAEEERFLRSFEDKAIERRTNAKLVKLGNTKMDKPWNSFFNDVEPKYNEIGKIYDQIDKLGKDFSNKAISQEEASNQFKQLQDQLSNINNDIATTRKSYNISDTDLNNYYNLMNVYGEESALKESNTRKRTYLEELDYQSKLAAEKRYDEISKGFTESSLLIAASSMTGKYINQLALETMKAVKPLAETFNLGLDSYDWTDKIYDKASALSKATHNATGYEKPDDEMASKYVSDVPYFYEDQNYNLPTSSIVMMNLSEGLGSAFAFMTPGGAAAKMFRGASLTNKIARQMLSKGGMFLQLEAMNYERNLKAGMTADDAAELSILQTLQDVAAESVFNELGMLNRARPAGFISALSAGLSKREAFKAGVNWIVDTGKSVAKSSAAESFEEALGQLSQDIGAKEAELLYNNRNFEDIFQAKAYANSMIAGGLTGGFLDGVRSLKPMSPSTMEALTYAGMNAREILQQVAILQNEGRIDQKKYKQIEESLNRLQSITQSSTNTPGFTELSQADQNAFVATLFQLEQLEENTKNLGIETEKSKKMKNILRQRATNIIEGKRTTDEGNPLFRTYMDANLQEMGVAVVDIEDDGGFRLYPVPGIDESQKDEIVKKATEYLKNKIQNDAIVAAKFQPKTKENAVQEPGTEEVLPRQQGEVTETGGQLEGVGPSIQGEEVTQEDEKKSIALEDELLNNPQLIEQRRVETVNQIERGDLFDGVGDFSSQLGGSDKAAVPVNRQKINGIEFVQYAHPETGSVDVVVTGTGENDFVGFYRIYENGKPTNKWSSKFENRSRNKEDFKTMISNVQRMLPEGHQYTEKTSISTDGLRIWNQQLERGYELQYDSDGNVITNMVAINGDAINNELGIPVDIGSFENISVQNKEDFEKVKKVLLPYLEKFGLGENNIHWLTGTVKIDLPVLKKSSQESNIQEGVTVEQQQISQDVVNLIQEIETAIENNEAVNEDKLVDAENKLYSLLDEIDSRQDLTEDQKARMSEVIENRITKLQNYDNRTRTETSTTTQAVAARRVEKAQGKNERAAIPVRTVAEEGIDVTYDGRAGRIELRDGQYVFVPKKLGAVQARPIVIGEAAQVNANSTFAGVENPTSGPNAVVANITLPNGSTLSVLNDDLSVDIGLEIAKQEVGAAPQALFDVVFDEVVSEQKREVPVQKKEEEQAPVQAEEQVQEAPVTEQQAPAVESGKAPYTGVTKEDRALKEKVKDDFRKRRILDQAQRIAMALGNSTPIFIHETTDDYNSALSERGLDMSKDSSNGKFVYAADGSVSEIHIDLSKANERTIPHEAVHAVLFKAFGDNQALFQDFKNRLKPLLEKSTVKQLEDFANSPAYVTEGVTAEEFMAELGGMMTAQGNRIPKTTLQKIAKLINEFVDKITKGKLKVFEDTARTSDVVDFFNSMADSFTKGKIFDVESKTKTGSSKLSSKFQYDFSDPVSKLSFVYDNNSDKFKELEKQGYITKDKKLQDFAGKFMLLHQPDAAFSGMIYKDGQLLVEGKGGMFYPIKFHKDGYFWASTEAVAKEMANLLNEVLEQNGGTIYMALTSAPYDKLMSSTTMSNAVLDFFSSKAFDNNFKITPAQLKVALIKAANYTEISKKKDKKGNIKEVKVGLDLKLKSGDSLKDIQSKIKQKLGHELSTFPSRKMFVVQLTKIIADKIKTDPIAVKQFGKLFSEGIQNKYFKGETKTGKLSISKDNMIQAMSEMFTEPILKEGEGREKGNSGKVYAILELKGKVKPVETDAHESYPIALKSDSKEKVRLHILKDRENWYDNFEDPTTGEIVKEERISNILPSSRGATTTGLKLKSKSQVTQQEAEDYISKLREEKAKDAKRGIPEMWSVSEPPIQDVKDGTIIKVEGGEAIVDKTGDIRGLYKYVDTEEKKVGDKLIKKAIDAGGIKLDNFALPNLMNIYQRNGFRVTSRLPFSKEFAPTGWTEDKHGNLTPDVVAMIYDPENKLDIEEKQFEDYDEAMAYRDSFIDDQNNAYPQGMKSKSQQESIPKAKSQESSMVSEINEAMNKTGLAKDNSVKRFIEKYGQNGLVAKQIIDNFDKIQEQLGITKICNI